MIALRFTSVIPSIGRMLHPPVKVLTTRTCFSTGRTFIAGSFCAHGRRPTLRLFQGLARCPSRGVTAPAEVRALGAGFSCRVHRGTTVVSLVSAVDKVAEGYSWCYTCPHAEWQEAPEAAHAAKGAIYPCARHGTAEACPRRASTTRRSRSIRLAPLPRATGSRTGFDDRSISAMLRPATVAGYA
jgi:hypothetical protein